MGRLRAAAFTNTTMEIDAALGKAWWTKTATGVLDGLAIQPKRVPCHAEIATL